MSGSAAFALVAGAVAGFLSGFLGIGGALVTTPIIRVLLARSAYVALGTTVPLIVPTATVAAIRYHRRGEVDVEAAVPAALAAVLASVAAGLETKHVAGGALMVVTALLMMALGAGVFSEAAFTRLRRLAARAGLSRRALAALSGLAAGLAAGFLGIGGGFLLVPAFMSLLEARPRVAFGTSLAVIAAVSVPSTVVHAALGHVDWALAGLLALTVIPGSYLGASVAGRVSERVSRSLFSAFLLVVGAGFLWFELA